MDSNGERDERRAAHATVAFTFKELQKLFADVATAHEFLAGIVARHVYPNLSVDRIP